MCSGDISTAMPECNSRCPVSATAGGGRMSRISIRINPPRARDHSTLTATNTQPCSPYLSPEHGERLPAGYKSPLFHTRAIRNSCKLTPSCIYDTISPRSGWSCRTTPSQTSGCFRTRPGTNSLPPSSAWHTGACQGNRRRGPCIGSRKTSAHEVTVFGPEGIAPESTCACSSTDNAGAAGQLGCTRG